MKNATLHRSEVRQQADTTTFTPLAQVQRTHVDTNAAAFYMNRRPQTLRGWHCHGDFPTNGLRPLVLNGRLAWSVAAIKAAMGVK
ncbi:MAG: DNA-binding protein [Polaromonas sp.]|uniref:DNA-binding protein n=1 Tax=Polaromonas sp. TaxID=1869339 RepID=UPI0024874E6D|nr:DNA-binding protein [Polaromonas sp.]MDI1270600.1 DNA-binding protein [Polaromonas sp.]